MLTPLVAHDGRPEGFREIPNAPMRNARTWSLTRFSGHGDPGKRVRLRNNLAVLSSDASQTATVSAGDLAGLLDAVTAAGLLPKEVHELQTAIQEDEAESSGDITEPGRRVRDFLGRQALRAGSVSGKIGISASGGVAAALVRNYYGLP